MTRGRARAFGLVAIAAITLGLVAMVPTSAAPGTDVVRLHLASNGRYFEWGDTTQQLRTSKNGCDLTSSEPIIDLSSTPDGSSPGLAGDGLGVKPAGGSNGTPCSQTDAVESLRLTPGPSLGSLQFDRVRLDVEMTGNAVVLLTLASSTDSATYRLQTGTSITSDQSGESGYDLTAPYEVASSPGDETDACAAPNSSGPNNSINDNCQWLVDPDFDFDSITLTTSLGTVALEGGGDFGRAAADHETLLYLAAAPPDAVDDTFTTVEDTPVSGNVLANDSDPEGDPLTASLVTPPADGSLTLASTGAFTYTPPADWSGTATFVYAASDGERTSNATATITVSPGNDPPVAADDSADVDEGGSVAIDVLANDTDIDGDELAVSDIAAISPTGATAVVGVDGSVTYTPPAGYTGAGSFTYRADDGAATSAPAMVSVEVVQVICSNDTVSDQDGDVFGSFTRLDDPFECKRYTVEADDENDTVAFLPLGGADVTYRGLVSFDPVPAPAAGGPGTVTLLLRYDPTGGTTYRPVQWCGSPVFDASGAVTSATVPAGESWCIASETTRGVPDGLVTVWQVYGIADPRFSR